MKNNLFKFANIIQKIKKSYFALEIDLKKTFNSMKLAINNNVSFLKKIF